MSNSKIEHLKEKRINGNVICRTQTVEYHAIKP